MASSADSEAGSDGNFVSKFLSELLSSPLNLALLGLCGFLLYKIIAGQKKREPDPPREPELPKLKKQDMTLEQLREYDGKGPDGRILFAGNGKIFDVTRGKRFYGPGWHDRLNGKACGSGLGFYRLVPFLRREAELTQMAVESGDLERAAATKRKAQQKALTTLWDRYMDGEVSTSEFLSKKSDVYRLRC